MSPVPASAITIADGEITIDAELFAPKLGLSAEALKAEMRKGNVSSVAETGINEDAGRARVTAGREPISITWLTKLVRKAILDYITMVFTPGCVCFK